MPKKFDVVATTGSYEKDGEEKRKYQNVGMVIEKDGKFYLKLNSLVTVDDNGQTINFFALFPPRQKEEVKSKAPDDDIPW